LLEPKSTEDRYPGLPLKVEGKIASDVHALPESLVMGPGRVGETLNESITLRSANGSQFEVVKIDTSSQDIAVESVTTPGDMGKTFRIAQRIHKEGTRASSIRFSVRKRSGDISTVFVNVILLGTSG
jgi:hypothetical protein